MSYLAAISYLKVPLPEQLAGRFVNLALKHRAQNQIRIPGINNIFVSILVHDDSTVNCLFDGSENGRTWIELSKGNGQFFR
jgi:hypothetical protein